VTHHFHFQCIKRDLKIERVFDELDSGLPEGRRLMPDRGNEELKLEIAKEELKIVRKFLRRNKFLEMYTVLQQVCDDLHGAKVLSGGIPISTKQKTAVPFQSVDWDPDGYFDSGEPTRLTVPEGLGGRYFVQAAVRWLNPELSFAPPDLDDINDAYYYAYVSKNGIDGALGLEAHSTTEKVGFGATGTTHHFTFDIALSADEFIELWLFQEFFDPVRADMALTLRRLGG
jgi:hypothetical protein